MLILLFSGNFSYTYRFLCNLLLYLPLATDLWWVSVIFNFIWPLLTDIGLIFKFLIFSPWKITFCRKNILSDTFSRGYPVWKCELWLDLSIKTQKYNSAGCDHELHIVGEQPTDYTVEVRHGHFAEIMTLHWRHNDRVGVSNRQPHGCLLNRLFRRRSKKTSKLRVTGLCPGNSPMTGEFPAQMACNADNVYIWWRHHETLLLIQTLISDTLCWQQRLNWCNSITMMSH